jgi:ribosomal protein S18 acetylase RimI-like enzyme
MDIKYRKTNKSKKDAKEIANVVVQSWNSTYQGIMPKNYLKNRINNFDEEINKTYNFINKVDNYLVSLCDDKIVGICYYMKSKNEEFKDYGYLQSIYVLDKYHNLGIGKELFKRCITDFINMGYNKMYLECARGNKTIDFYKHFGGIVKETIDYTISDFTIKADIVVYEDLISALNILNKR